MSRPDAQLTLRVQARAGRRCEYCKMHDSLQGATFHVEHVMPRSRGGTSDFPNLAWCCPSCNLHKSNRVEAPDPSGSLHPLFNPRTMNWSEHFSWEQSTLVGLTPVGEVTISALDLNQSRRLLIRQAESMFGLFPPK